MLKIKSLDYLRKNFVKGGYGEWTARDNKRVRALSTEDKAKLDDIIEKHNSRLSSVRVVPAPLQCKGITGILARRHSEIESLIVGIVEENYRCATGRWAGGETSVAVTLVSRGEIGMSGQSETAWSDNGKWKGKNAVYHVCVRAGWKKYVYNKGLADAGGLLTLDAEEIDPGLWAATWAQQSRGFTVKVVSGYIKKSDIEINGIYEYYHAETIAKIQRLETKAFDRWNEKVYQKERLKKLAEHQEEIFAHYKDVKIGLAFAMSCGNCETGVLHFREKYFPGRKEATLGELRNVAWKLPPLSDVRRRVERIIHAAIIQ
jgi:hypothetical protein